MKKLELIYLCDNDFIMSVYSGENKIFISLSLEITFLLTSEIFTSREIALFLLIKDILIWREIYHQLKLTFNTNPILWIKILSNRPPLNNDQLPPTTTILESQFYFYSIMEPFEQRPFVNNDHLPTTILEFQFHFL